MSCDLVTVTVMCDVMLASCYDLKTLEWIKKKNLI